MRVVGADVSQPKVPGSLPTPRYIDQSQYEWAAWERGFLDRVANMGGGLDKSLFRVIVAIGEPGAEILRAAVEEAVDIIGLPWHGHLQPDKACTVKAVLKGAPCPVLMLLKQQDRRYSR